MRAFYVDLAEENAFYWQRSSISLWDVPPDSKSDELLHFGYNSGSERSLESKIARQYVEQWTFRPRHQPILSRTLAAATFLSSPFYIPNGDQMFVSGSGAQGARCGDSRFRVSNPDRVARR